MKRSQRLERSKSFWQRAALLVVLAITASLPALQRAEAATNIVLWDTWARSADNVDLANRAGWKPVPRDLLTLEADPPKASSDPGYYGRDYSFTGDAVVENSSLTAVFSSAQGRLVIYSKANAATPDSAPSGSTAPGRKILELLPVQTKTQSTGIKRCQILKNSGDEVALEVSFVTQGSADVSVVFGFGRNEIVEVKPAENVKGLRVLSPVEYGVVPSFVGDDLIFDPAEHSSENALSIPSENIFVGLLRGEESMLVMSWPKGKQQMRLTLGNPPQGKRLVEAIEFDNDGQSLYLAALGAPGIWHREELTASYLEKDTPIKWKRPFPAKWKTQLYEAEVKTTFGFRESKGQVWRGVPGSYSYPVWFSGDGAWYHLSKKVPPKGESVIYFLEGQDTPLSVSTPVDILKATLGRQTADPILDIAGRKLHTHHRRGAAGVHRACTCGCTEVIQAVFEAGQEVTKKEEIQGALDDMVYFIERHMERIEAYKRFADDTIKFLQAKASSSPELKPYIESLQQTAQQIPQEYGVQKENMRSLDYAGGLTRQTLALAGKKDANNLKAYMDLLKAWRAMGGAQDYVLAQCHTITRKLCQEAGYGCVAQPDAVALAEEIRRRCRQVLRNPDGYEIWADY